MSFQGPTAVTVRFKWKDSGKQCKGAPELDEVDYMLWMVDLLTADLWSGKTGCALVVLQLALFGCLFCLLASKM